MKNFEIEIEKAFAEVKERTAGMNFLMASHIRMKCREYLGVGEELKNSEIREMLGKEAVAGCVKYLETATHVLCGMVKELDRRMGDELDEEIKEEIEEIKAAIN